MSMLPTGTVLPRIPLRCSLRFSDKNRSMSICNETTTKSDCQTLKIIHKYHRVKYSRLDLLKYL